MNPQNSKDLLLNQDEDHLHIDRMSSKIQGDRRSRRSSISVKSMVEEFEVVVDPSNMDDDMGQVDAEQLQLEINNPPEREESDSNDLLDRNKEKCQMVFYLQNQDPLYVESMADLKGSSIANAIQTSVFWLDVCAYDLTTLNVLANVFGIHPLTVEDIWDEETSEKCELFEDYTFICVRALLGFNEETRSHLDTDCLYLICCEKFVITFHLLPLNNISNIHKRLDRFKNLKITPGWILYAILDNIVDAYIPIVGMIEMEGKSIDELVLILNSRDQNDMLRRIGEARKKVTQLQKLTSLKGDIFKMLQTREQRFKKANIQPEVFLYLGDVSSHVHAMEQNLSHFHEILDRAHSNYLARISIELTEASNRMGLTMKKFSAGACIFLPLTLISGMMGMNVRVPGNLDGKADSVIWFYVICALMILIALALVLIGRFKKWF